MTPRGSVSWKMLHFLESLAVWIAVSFKDDLGVRCSCVAWSFTGYKSRTVCVSFFPLVVENKSSCSLGCPQIHYASETDLELLVFLSPLSSKYYGYKCITQHAQLFSSASCVVALRYSLGDTLWSIIDLHSNWHPMQHHWAYYTASLINALR